VAAFIRYATRYGKDERNQTPLMNSNERSFESKFLPGTNPGSKRTLLARILA